MWFLIFIRLSMKASPEGRLIVTQDPCFLKPRESAISHAPLLRARGSVRRASGFVLTGNSELEALGDFDHLIGGKEAIDHEAEVAPPK